MNLSEAKMILEMHGNDLEDAQDRYEELVFQQRQLFFRDPVIPSLFKARVQKIKTLWEAFSFIKNDIELEKEAQVRLNSLKGISNWKTFFEIYEGNKSAIRKEIANTFLLDKIESLTELMIDNEKEYTDVFISRFSKTLIGVETKISEAVATVEILKECESLMNIGKITESLDSIYSLPDNLVTFNLSREINRMRKLIF